MKKFLSLLLTVAIVLSTLCLPAVAENEPVAQSEKAYGTVADDYQPAEGSTAIGTLEELLAISQNVTEIKSGTYAITGSYHLTADITVNFDTADAYALPLIQGSVTIPAAEEGGDPTVKAVKLFSGTLDGCGHTIKFVYGEGVTLSFAAATSMIFGTLTSSTIKNLIVDNAKFTTSAGGGGVFATSGATGGVNNFRNVAITNAALTGTGTGGKNIGGFIGANANHSANFYDCKFQGSITSEGGNVGGFIAKTEITGHLYVEGCEIDATLESKASNSTWGLGGFFGYVGSNCSVRFGKENDVKTDNAVPTAANKVNMKTTASQVNAGGLIGLFVAAPTTSVKIDDETSYINGSDNNPILFVTGTNEVTVDITLTKQMAGGLVGAIQSNYTVAKLGYGEEGTEGYVAPRTGIINIQQNVVVNGSVTSSGARAGGFIGHYGSNARLRMSKNGTNYAPTNKATVTGYLGAGGIIGIMGATGKGNPGNTLTYDVILNGVVNSGAIAQTEGTLAEDSLKDRKSDAAAGIIGTIINITSPDGPSTITLKNKVTNTGTITAAKYGSSAGIVGCLSAATDTTVLVTGAQNSGEIKDAGSITDRGVGGILGLLGGSNSITIENSTNTGKITGKKKDGGGIVGRMQSTGILTIDNCVNSGTLNVTNYTGGLCSTVGAAGTVNISNSMNTANISGNYVGGMVVRTTAAATINITNCINLGNLSGTKPAGVLSQANGSSKINVYNFHNGGDITASGYGGAFVAYDGKGSAATIVVKNSTNSGTIGGTGKVGVFTGGSEASSTVASTYTFENCLHFVGAEGVTEGVVFAPASEEEFAPTVTLNGCATIAADYAIDSTSDMFRVLDGARLRLSSKGEEDNGLRFDIVVDQALVDALVAAGYEVELKSLMALASSVDATNFTKESLKSRNEKFSDSKDAATVKEDGKYAGTYAAALINLKESQYQTKFACVGYIRATNANGDVITIYTAYDADDNARSIAYVANAALEDNANGQYDAYETLLKDFAGIN